MNIILLTHPREMLRENNTGQLVSPVLGDRVRVVEWHRKQPDAELLRSIAASQVGLVFPSTNENTLEKTGEITKTLLYLVIIDATWQEARKIFNQSPYLQGLPRVPLMGAAKSIYPLRRNQIEGGLCTAECVIHLLTQWENVNEAQQLHQSLMALINR
ncbi:tRNA-uridine aminocarboxypropyltransferase [Shewanella sp. A14]